MDGQERAAAPVLVFDSGLGGLSVLRELRAQVRDYPFVYVADDAGFPYGDWQEGALRERLVVLFGTLLVRYAPQVVVIACNTASTLALADLRAAYPAVVFVGTVPAIKPAAARTRSGQVSVLATPGTVQRAYTRELIDEFAASCRVTLVGAAGLAAMAEQQLRGDAVDEQRLRELIAPCFVEQEGQRTDIVVLACTHYPFLLNTLRAVAPWPVDWLDPAEAIARRTRSLLPQRDAAAGEDRVLLTSGVVDPALQRVLQGFGLTRVDTAIVRQD